MEFANHVVEFLGEGGEAVTVTMAVGYVEKADSELIETAKQMLVQVVPFDRHEFGSAAPERSEAEIYTFEYQDKGIIRLMPGISLPGLEAVRDEVYRSAKDLWKDAPDKAEAPVGWAVRARNSQGDIEATCTYEEIQLREA
ncbi:hypothetical protein MESS2_1630012 [Mesorhizobium metallidurans STM 2683]|uniref:DUF6894 domain-containing protein n=1 Tax=Mesorhizobium metallidurans STM 2683 TaxID=1297569 RepID=M5EN98_9HYPH|nr:hypothetical protein [Mesorhizobium metallidurans]CCV05655.1 hypothetical protein MESS2_1630012 [Mesorhizobium metallidurans STM 2683]